MWRGSGARSSCPAPGYALNGATILAEHICTYFKNMNWKRKDTGQTIGQVFISLGVSEYRPENRWIRS